ncbi:MAG: UvrD-helicase domain-containing protein [Patescibacteria group bacterium]
MSTLLNNLNEPQKEAVQTMNGPLLVIAGAGSGKTKLLTCKIAYLIEKGIKPYNILAVTFTNKAAGEMKERVKKLAQNIKISVDGLNIGTFHSICMIILRENTDLVGIKKNFVIFDSDDQISLIKTILKEENLDPEKFKPRTFQSKISNLKSNLKSPSAFENEASDYISKITSKIYTKYQQYIKEYNAVDFDDIIMFCVKLFQNNQEILEKYQEKFKYILIDEYQDTNSAQYNLVKLLAQKHHNICVVGDNDQAIYGWRAADYKNILNFEKDYPSVKEIILDENYRSTKNIINAANGIIVKNKARKEKNLFTSNEKGGKINLILASSERKESEFITKKIKELAKKENRPFSDFVILYRANAQSRAVEEEFMKASLPYKIIGGFKFYQRKEVKDIIAYLRYIHNESDKTSFQRVVNTPARGIGKVTLDKYLQTGEISKNLQSFFQMIASLKEDMKSISLSRLIREIAKKSKIEENLKDGTKEGESKLENVLELISVASIYDKEENAISKFLENIALISDQDDVDQEKPLVNLMTIHASKGLEFDVVFILGMEDGIFPHERSKNSTEELEEERRLCYVALTRAKKNIYLLHTEKRNIFGRTETNPPSRFLYDIPQELIEFEQYPTAEFKFRDEMEEGIIDFE